MEAGRSTCPVPAWDTISGKLGLLKDDHHVAAMDRRRMAGAVSDAGFQQLEYRRFMWAPISFLPYLHIPVPAELSIRCDRLIASAKVLNWLFVNQAIIGRKPSQ